MADQSNTVLRHAMDWPARLVRVALLKAFTVIALVWVAPLAAAADFTPEQKVKLESRIAAFDTAIRANDVAKILKVTPPKIYDFLSEQAGMPVEELQKLVVTQMSEVMKDVKVQELEMDASKAEFLTTPDGTGYALVPSHFVMSMPEVGTIETKSHTLALMDNDQWYLLRIDNPQQLLIMKQVYPSFTDVEFPRGSVKTTE